MDYDCTKPNQTTVYKLEEMMVRAVLNNLDHEEWMDLKKVRLVGYVNESPEHEFIDFRNAVKRGKIVVNE